MDDQPYGGGIDPHANMHFLEGVALGVAMNNRPLRDGEQPYERVLNDGVAVVQGAGTFALLFFVTMAVWWVILWIGGLFVHGTYVEGPGAWFLLLPAIWVTLRLRDWIDRPFV